MTTLNRILSLKTLKDTKGDPKEDIIFGDCKNDPIIEEPKKNCITEHPITVLLDLQNICATNMPSFFVMGYARDNNKNNFTCRK